MQLSQESSYKYLFSIVMAIYNVEEYLEEAIKSVVNQTLSFEKHVQLILINDGSPDNSERICLKYQQKYPDNVVYVKKENGGVSSARNEGLKHVQGKYVNFLDPDDKLSENTLHEVFVFFEDNYAAVDVVAIPMYLFEGRQGPHPLNYKFNKKTRVIDLLVEYDQIQLSSSSTFVSSRALIDRNFDERLKFAEDAELLNKIILEKCKLGVVEKAKYYYRKRMDNSSAIQGGHYTKEWYEQNLDNFSLSLIQHSISKMGFVTKYIQFVVMYDLKWRFNMNKIFTSLFSADEQQNFIEKAKYVLSYIDDEVILRQKEFNIHRKIFALQLKYNDTRLERFKTLFLKNDVLLYYNQNLVDSLKNQTALISLLELKGNQLIIEGNFGSLFNRNSIKIILLINGSVYEVESISRPFHTIYSLGIAVKEYYGFRINVPIDENKFQQKLEFFVELDSYRVPIGLDFKRFSKLSKELKESYYFKDKILIVHGSDNSLIISKCNTLGKIKKEIKLLKSLFKSKEIGAGKAIIARLTYHLVKKMFFRNKNIWLLLDRVDKADDNAEHLFHYAIKQKDGIKKYFVIRKNVKDYERLKKCGTVIPFGSYRHKLYHLLAEKIISSHSEEWVDNPFFSLEKYYRDLMNFEYVFLQHGVTKDNVSRMLNKYNKNFKLFITSSFLEYKSIVEGNYGYDKGEVKLTGFPRFDNLVNDDSRQILIMPTWRASIVKGKNLQTGKRPYSKMFRESEYFKLFNSLINDPKFIEAAKERGYKIIFFPHPEIKQQLTDFERNDYVIFEDYATSYQKLFNESSMLITDYSSVAFDIAYLKKPVLYFQFDENHYENGYYNYETMGFGEICTNYNQLIDLIIEYINNDCKMKDKYVKRVESFYAFTDRKNCQRVYDAIKDMNKTID